MTTRLPNIIWCQRKKFIYLKVLLTNVKEEKINLTTTHFSFHGVGSINKITYDFEIEFSNEVDPKTSKWSIKDRYVDFLITKKDFTAKYWKYLCKDGKKHWIKVDWDKYIDESDEESGESDNSDENPMNLNLNDYENFEGEENSEEEVDEKKEKGEVKEGIKKDEEVKEEKIEEEEKKEEDKKEEEEVKEVEKKKEEKTEPKEEEKKEEN
ncbi:co-chaperone protein daf-41 [Anaeramoeba flamelloides]|uniref:Co-chaperone protein daf-41 n=1 Tax=Anaeramoeba flamelloides TaxID=1746091 RepID=A0AAV7ZPM9_9EUKA|nr:co-chaperone protein daf-41 [Anaeramoeba flamelloides]